MILLSLAIPTGVGDEERELVLGRLGNDVHDVIQYEVARAQRDISLELGLHHPVSNPGLAEVAD